MGAPDSGMQAAEQPAAEELLGAFKRIDAADRRKHEAVLNYWLSIRGDKEFPPLHDLDPLELSDAAPHSILLELISGGHDAEIRHLGETLKDQVDVERIIDASHPSLLSSIAKKLPIVAISRDFLAFQDEYSSADGKTRCWVTLLPLSAGGAWVDYVYALVSLATEGAAPAKAAEPAKKPAKKPEPEETAAAEVEEPAEAPAEVEAKKAAPEPEEIEKADEAAAEVNAEEAAQEPEEIEAPVEEPEEALEESSPEAVQEEEETEELAASELVEAVEPEAPAVEAAAAPEALEDSVEAEADEPAPAKSVPGFSKIFDSLAGLAGFYGSQGIKADPVLPPAPEPVAEEPAEEATAAGEPVDQAPAAEEVFDEPVEDAPVAEELVEEPTAAEKPADAPAAKSVAELLELAEQVAAEMPASQPQPAPAPEGTLQSKLDQVRAKADEALAARQRATAALYEGLSAAYDFAVDAEEAPEEYLRLVEAQGLKIQLRSPMKPVVKLAFAETCDEATIKQLEAVLAWALKEELPRGTLLERLEAAGGVAGVLNGEKRAA